MKISIELLDSQDNNSKMDISLNNVYGDEYIISLYTSINQKFEDVLTDKNILRMLNTPRKFKDILPEYYESVKTIVKDIKDKGYDYIKKFDTVIIQPQQEYIDYIEKNPILKTKKILLDGIYGLDKSICDRLQKLFKDYDNVYILVNGNRKEIKLSDYKKTIDAIENIVAKILKYDLSPLEQIMYAYDLVRERIYTKEEDDDHSKSRDLTPVLLGDKIVCLGYANVLNNILNRLGINNIIWYLKSNKNLLGHARNLIYLKDEKNNIDGLYFLDATFDSKENKSDKDYLRYYRYFCKTKSQMDGLNPEYEDLSFSGFDLDFIYEFEDFIEKNGASEIPMDTIETINNVSKFIDGKNLINRLFSFSKERQPSFLKKQFDKEKIFDSLYRYESLLFQSRRLFASDLLEAFYNVRKVEYYEDSSKYPFSIEEFVHVLRNSLWIDESTFKERLLSQINSKPLKPRMATLSTSKRIIKEFSLENNLDQNVENVKLAKTLRLVYEKKKNG